MILLLPCCKLFIHNNFIIQLLHYTLINSAHTHGKHIRHDFVFVVIYVMYAQAHLHKREKLMQCGDGEVDVLYVSHISQAFPKDPKYPTLCSPI